MSDKAAGALDRVRRELGELFLEREAVVDGLLCALLSRQHVLIVGPPGTGKSELAHELCRRIQGAEYFQWLLTRFTTPEELFGPVSLRGLEQDRYVRVTDRRLPRAHVVFLDEVFKASSAILNTLLAVMNERRFHDGDGPDEVPLLTLVGAANELPEEDELLALYDRFLLRFDVDYLREDYLFLRMLAREEPRQRTTLTLRELEQLQERAARVRVPEALRRDLLELRARLSAKGIVASDRRYRQSLDLLRAHAFLEGREACNADDLRILEHVLWSEPGERGEVQDALRALAFGHEDEAQRLLFQAREIADMAQADPRGESSPARAEALAKLHDLSRRLDGLLRETESRGRRPDGVLTCRDEVRGLVRALLAGDIPGEPEERARRH